MKYLPALVLALAASASAILSAAEPTLLNVSYDVTREFYKEFNAAFTDHWKAATGESVTVKQSHGGSSAQIRAVLDGLAADVVTMNGITDVDRLAQGGFIPADWQKRLPNESVPYNSTILFIVRKGNPKGIKDWSDLVRDGVSVIIPNPKTSGNGRYSYLAAWGYALRQPGGNEAKAREFVRKLFQNVPVLDTGGRGATTTFAQRGTGDVLLTFENEVASTVKDVGEDKVVAKNGTEKLAKAYLEFLFSPAAQELAAKYRFRPIDKAVAAGHAGEFPALPLFSVPEVFGSWENAQKVHFTDGGTFDQIYNGK